MDSNYYGYNYYPSDYPESTYPEEDEMDSVFSMSSNLYKSGYGSSSGADKECDYNKDYDRDVNNLLDEIEDMLIKGDFKKILLKVKKDRDSSPEFIETIKAPVIFDHEEFSDDSMDEEEVPDWYKNQVCS